jgi:hypothetical protein
MMASVAVKCADEIVAYLNGQTIGDMTLPCVRKLVPDQNLASVKTLQLMVVPHSLDSRIVARGGVKERVVRVDVGVVKRAAESELEGLLDLAQGIGDLLEGHVFASGICIEVSYAPLYDAEFWLQQQSFFAVIVAKIKVLS